LLKLLQKLLATLLQLRPLQLLKKPLKLLSMRTLRSNF
jgi:hypothetical protein